MPENPTCSTCRWWNRLAAEPYIPGECRRHAPVVCPVSDGRRHVTAFPSSMPNDFCGEHDGRSGPGEVAVLDELHHQNDEGLVSACQSSTSTRAAPSVPRHKDPLDDVSDPLHPANPAYPGGLLPDVGLGL